MPSRHLARHLEWCHQRNLRTSYVDTRRRTVHQLARELGCQVEFATETDFAEWYEQLSARLTPEARGVYLSHVQQYFRWLIRNELVEKDPTVRLVRPRTRPGVPRPMNDQELARAIRTAPARVKPWLLLQALGGLRAIEVANLRVNDIDLKQGLLVVNGKGGKQRLVPIHPLVRECLLPLMERRGFLFSHWSGQGAPTAHNVSYAVNHHLRRQGISSTAHSARHWFLTNIYRLSKDIRLTQELAGHSSPTTTARYAAWSPDKAAGTVNGLQLEP